MRPAVAADRLALLALLRRDVAGSMFPLANLEAGGPGVAGGDPHAMRVWVMPDASGMLGLTAQGALLPQAPAAGDWPGLRAALAGESVTMAVGRSAQVPGLLAALGLAGLPTRHAGDEPGFVLDLADLAAPPPGGCRVVPLTDAFRSVVTPWRAAYLTETFGLPAAEAAVQGTAEVERWFATGSHRILLRGDQPVAMSGFNARLPGVVQVGGVYTPPALRGQGLARRVVAGHLAEARAQGVQRAVLFAANDAAAAAYRAIGFQRQGSMAIVQFHTPQRITA